MSDLLSLTGSIMNSCKPYGNHSVCQSQPSNETRGKVQITIKTEKTKETSVSDLLLGILLFPFLISGCAQQKGVEKIKGPEDLTTTEQEAFNQLLIEVYTKSVELRSYASFVKVTYFYHPKTETKLQKPIKTIGAVIYPKKARDTDESIKAKIQKNLSETFASWEESGKTKTIKVADANIIIEYSSVPEPYDNSMIPNDIYDEIIVFPKKIRITER